MEAVTRAKKTAADHVGANQDGLTLVDWRAVTWPDGAMGCPKPGMAYITAEVPGFIVRFDHQGETVTVYAAEDHGYAFVPSECLPTHLPSGRPR